MAQTTDHPTWCTRDRVCAAEGIHRSRPVPATTPEAHAALRLWLEQAHLHDAPVSVILEVTEEGDTRYCWLAPAQARVLRHQLGRLLDASKAGQR